MAEQFLLKRIRTNRGEFDAVVNENDCILIFINPTDEFAQWIGEMITMLWRIQMAHESLFHQCYSNPVYNTWGKEVNVSKVNEINEEAGRLLERIDLPSLIYRRRNKLDVLHLPDGKNP